MVLIPSIKSDGESKTFHIVKRIPPAIPKLRQSFTYVNRHPGQAGAACDFCEQAVTLLETVPFDVIIYYQCENDVLRNVQYVQEFPVGLFERKVGKV
jgi:hypothetical protein